MTEDKNSVLPQSTNKSTILIILIIALAFYSGYLWNKTKSLENKQKGLNQQANNNAQQKEQAPPQEPDYKIKKPSPKDDHWSGDKNVRYVWVEYSDFECFYCKNIHSNLIKLTNQYKGKIAWVFRQFPLQGHPKAQKSAEAAECAAGLAGNDGFWKMADLIFEKMPVMELSDLPNLASQIGLNKNSFSQCLNSGKFEKKVKDQLKEAEQIGIQATPTGVIYDLKTGKSKPVRGALPFEALKNEIENFLKS